MIVLTQLALSGNSVSRQRDWVGTLRHRRRYDRKSGTVGHENRDFHPVFRIDFTSRPRRADRIRSAVATFVWRAILHATPKSSVKPIAYNVCKLVAGGRNF